jgi:hypothetical protein
MDDAIQKEIIRRAVIKSERKEKEELRQFERQATFDALREMTGLPRTALEKIETQVRASFGGDRDTFFSVRHQLILAILIVLTPIVILKLI